jgi:hypothetical protein
MCPTTRGVNPAVTMLACVLGGLCAAGCATRAETVSRGYLDEHTGATVTVAARALVFARDRPEYAVNARDYLTLVPVDVNRTGTHVQYFYAYSWTTVDKPAGVEATGQFELIADGREIALTPAAKSPHALGFGATPVPPPSRTATTLIFPTTREVLRFVSQAHEVRVLRTRDGLGERFDLWQDGRGAIVDLLQGGVAAR